jgi:D-3-phosphoglycerate dehydrogenase / 2-oxoglutarate reductase
VLVVGDSFAPTTAFADAFAGLEATHEFDYLQLDGDGDFQPTTVSERRISEYAGSPAQLSPRMAGVEVLVVHGAPVTREVLGASNALRLVCCARGGPRNVDLDAASELGIPVVTTPGKNAESVADQTVCFLVMLARGLPKAQRFVTAGGRLGGSTFEGFEFFGHELGGHVLGLVGYGNVGRCVAQRVRPFGLDVIAFDPFVTIGPGEPVRQVPELAALLAAADFVSLHARATADNDRLFDGAAFAAMKPGAYFVNTARETLVDEQALDAALASGRVAGAALDVIRPHAAPGPHPLLRHENVVITPHIAGATYETLQRGARMLADEMLRFSSGESPVNIINRAELVA